jgi:hypothetical protein
MNVSKTLCFSTNQFSHVKNEKLSCWSVYRYLDCIGSGLQGILTCEIRAGLKKTNSSKTPGIISIIIPLDLCA